MLSKKSVAIALLSTAGLLSTAAPASADDFSFGISFGGGHSRPRGHVGFRTGGSHFRPAPIVPGPFYPRPAYPVPVYPRPIAVPTYPTLPAYPTYPSYPTQPPPQDDCSCECRQVYIPPHEVCRQETVCEPPVYEDRCVPVYESVCVPIYEEQCDPYTGRMVRVQVGQRFERRQTGTRMERVMVRPETCRTITVRDVVPGRYVTVCDHPGEHRHEGVVMAQAEYDVEMARVGGGAATGSFR